MICYFRRSAGEPAIASTGCRLTFSLHSYFWDLFWAPSQEQCVVKQVTGVGPTCLSFLVCLCGLLCM